MIRAASLALLLAWAPLPARAGTRHIGVSLPLSGEKKESGTLILNAIRLRVEELNAAGGDELDLVVLDDANDPVKARENAEDLARDPRVLAVLGHYDTAAALQAQPVYDKAGVTAFYPTIGDPQVVGRSPWAFGGTGYNGSQAETIAVYLKTVLRCRRALVIHTDDHYGTHLESAFSMKARRLGLETRSMSFREDDPALPPDFVSKRLAAKDASFDAVVVFAHSVKGAALISQLRARGISAPVYGGERLSTGLLEKLGNDGRGLHIAFPYMYDLASLEARRFTETYRERFGAPPSIFAAFAYDGVSLIADALKSESPGRASVRDHLASLDSPDKAVPGLSGPLYFGPSRCIARDVILSDFRRGEFRPAFTQLRVVTEKHTLEILDEKVRLGEVLLVDQVPYFKIQVVYAGIDLAAINSVRTESLSFDAELFLWLKWTGELDTDNIILLNQLPGGRREELRRRVGAENWVAYKVKGTFEAAFDLKGFPFDTQRLPFVIAHKNKNANKLQLVVDHGFLSGRSLSHWPGAWVYGGREDSSGTFNYRSTFGNPTYLPGEDQADFSLARTDVAVKRLLFTYVVTLFLPLVILTGISLSALFVPIEDFSPRASTILTSLLGILLQHLGFAKSMPAVGYLVKADYYFLAAYVFLSVLVVENCVVRALSARSKGDQARRFENVFKRVYIPVVLVFYGAMTVLALRAR